MEDENFTPELEQDENENQDDVDVIHEDDQDDKTDWKAEARKYKAILERQSKREEKQKAEEKPVKNDDFNLSPLDAIAIAKADVPIEDIDDVIEIAKLRKVSIREALGLNITKMTLAEKEEYRKTAKASNPGGGKRAPQTTSPDTLLKNLSEGKTPERGTKEAEDLFWARRGGKR